jgi:hypothetical protein
MVDLTCRSSAHAAEICCEADKNGCLVDIPCDDTDYIGKVKACQTKYLECLAGIKKKE